MPATSTSTETLTLVSGFSPEFSTIATNVGLAPLRTWLSVVAVERVLAPTLTPVRALPCVPGASAPFDEAGARPVRRVMRVAGVSQPTSDRKRVPAVVCPWTPFAAKVWWISGTTRCE